MLASGSVMSPGSGLSLPGSLRGLPAFPRASVGLRIGNAAVFRSIRRRGLQVFASSSSAEAEVGGPGVATASPYVPIVATAAFVATTLQKYTLQRDQLLVALGAIAIAQAALSLVKPSFYHDWVSGVAAPAVLAWHALNVQFYQIHYMEVAIAVFGWYLCKNLEGPSLAWAATLGVALYTHMGATWYAAAYGVVAGWKLLQSYRSNSKVTLQFIPPVIASIWAIYKQCPLTWTIILMLSQIAGSALGMIQSVSNSATD